MKKNNYLKKISSILLILTLIFTICGVGYSKIDDPEAIKDFSVGDFSYSYNEK